jgi:Kdo2-lipid IVA lauroyltransferase/acyltransferase
MERLSYLLYRSFQGLVAIIPFRIIYLLSDFCAILMQYIIRYRLKTVTENLTKAFPEKGKEDIKRITRLYYKNLCDITLESIKGFNLSTNQLLNRYNCLNPEVSNDYFNEGKDVIFAMSHYGNWEWGTQVASIYFKHNVVSFYKPLSNKYIDAYIQKNRMKHNMNLESIYKTKFIFRSRDEKPKAYFLVSDQSPGKHKKAYWVRFLNQDTACMHGIESYARLFNVPVIYVDVQRVARGYYTIRLEEICSDPQVTSDGEITYKYMKTLEKIVEKKPEDWLWSHRRWKIKNPPDRLLSEKQFNRK